MRTVVKGSRRLMAAIAAIVGLAVGVGGPAAAAPLVLAFGGILGADSTLDGVAFDAPRAFAFSALFDSAADLSPIPGVGLFEASVTFEIEGVGAVAIDPAGDVEVLLTGFQGARFFDAGLVDSALTSVIVGEFGTATPAFFASAPIPTILSDPVFNIVSLPFVFPVAGGGELVIQGLDGLNDRAVITAVPEPVTPLLLAVGLAALGLARRQRSA